MNISRIVDSLQINVAYLDIRVRSIEWMGIGLGGETQSSGVSERLML